MFVVAGSVSCTCFIFGNLTLFSALVTALGNLKFFLIIDNCTHVLIFFLCFPLQALKLHGNPLLGRDVRLDLAREKGSNTPYSKDSSSFPKGGSGQSQTIFVRGFDKSAGEDEVMISHCGSFKGQFCGPEISRGFLMVCSIQIFTD
jgi:hypothetical protein